MEELFSKLSDEMLRLDSVRQKEDVTSAELKRQCAKARIGAQILIGLVERGTNCGHFVFIGLLCIALHHRHLLFIAIFRPLAPLQPTPGIPSLQFLILFFCQNDLPANHLSKRTSPSSPTLEGVPANPLTPQINGFHGKIHIFGLRISRGPPDSL